MVSVTYHAMFPNANTMAGTALIPVKLASAPQNVQLMPPLESRAMGKGFAMNVLGIVIASQAIL